MINNKISIKIFSLFVVLALSPNNTGCMRFTKSKQINVIKILTDNSYLKSQHRFAKKERVNVMQFLGSSNKENEFEIKHKNNKLSTLNKIPSDLKISKKNISKQNKNSILLSKKYMSEKNNIPRLLITKLAKEKKPQNFLEIIANEPTTTINEFEFIENEPETLTNRTKKANETNELNITSELNEASELNEVSKPNTGKSNGEGELYKNTELEKNYRKTEHKLIKLGSSENLPIKQTLKPRKTFKQLLKKITIDFETSKINIGNKINKRILGINGSVFFCDLSKFTLFCNKCKNYKTPVIFMTRSSDLAIKIINHWGGYTIAIAGDAYIALFPKEKFEKTEKESSLNALLCCIKLISKISNYMKEQKQTYFPKQCSAGMETGIIGFYKMNKSINAVSKAINNSQRNQTHSKQLKSRKITITEKTYNLLCDYDGIKELFPKSSKSLIKANGIELGTFVRSCNLQHIEDFRKSKYWKIYKNIVFKRIEKNRPVENLNKLFDSI